MKISRQKSTSQTAQIRTYLGSYHEWPKSSWGRIISSPRDSVVETSQIGYNEDSDDILPGQ